jgi:spore coat polysaccharide biosynthesis protein SpsF
MDQIVRVVVQARMNSSRLPGKILAPLVGRPILAHVVTRLRAARAYFSNSVHRWQVLVATSTASADEATESLCRELGVACFRGPEDDVLARYVAATADLADDDVVVRATADNPLYCPQRTAAIVEEHLRSAADYTCIENLSYVVPEVVRVAALRAMSDLAGDSYCREHVTPYFRQGPCGFRVKVLPADWRGLRDDIRLTVDAPGEFIEISRVLEQLQNDDAAVSLEDVYEFWEAGGSTWSAARGRSAGSDDNEPLHETSNERRRA